mgnify:CR=1 FL=1
MAAFTTTRFFPTGPVNLDAVARTVAEQYEREEYIVVHTPNAGGEFISVQKGGIFQKVLGLQTALNIEISAVPNGVSAKAGIGVLGRQVLPSLIAYFIAWPIIIAQIWGLVSQSKMDERALDLIGQAIQAHQTGAPAPAAAPAREAIFCMHCGKPTTAGMAVCPSCGKKL